MTDGRDNASTIDWEKVRLACKNIPLHIYGISGGITGILQLKSVIVKDTIIIDDLVSVPFRWKAEGLDKSKMVELSVQLDGVQVATKTVSASNGEEISDVLTFMPKKDNVKVGKHDLVASIRVLGSTEADKLTRSVKVVESKVKILYVENSPRWEFKFLMRYLLGEKERSIDPTIILISGDEKTIKEAPFTPAFPRTRKELFTFDMIIIGDVDAAYFTPDQKKWIVEFVEEGGGLVMIAGRRYNPSSYLDDPIETRQENLKVWNQLPGWYWHYPVKQLKPLAHSLLDHPKEQIEDLFAQEKDKKKPMPLIAEHSVGRGGIVLFFATDETWRWRFNEADKLFGRFWGQVIYRAGIPHMLGGKSQFITPDGDFMTGQTNNVYVRLRTTDNLPLERARIPATVKRAGDQESKDPVAADSKVVFEPVKGEPGLYVAKVKKEQHGDYILRFDESFPENPQLPIRFSSSQADETALGNLNESQLRQLAGKKDDKVLFYREENLKDLVDDVTGKTVPLDPPPRREILLWTRWWVLASIVGLLTIEWLIRKFSNLS
ncbi:MAG: hypothetical protein K8T89_00280 [Planctomycetes bacterium]|nr:hypothetical protein [Planctomycetota bacterium]